MKAFALLLAIVPLPLLAETSVQIPVSVEAPVVTVSATESVDAAPDLAIVGAGVSTLAPTASAALQANSVKMTRMVAAVRAAGVAERDVQTRGISISADYAYINGAQQFRGYRASNTVQIRSRDIAGLGKFLDALVAAGGNQIDGPNFTLDKPEPLIAQARAKAVATAQANADALARAAGFKRARLLTIGEVNTARPVVMMREQAFSVAPPVVQTSAPIAPGEVSTSVTLTGSYRLEN
jgi:uncharacterized protein